MAKGDQSDFQVFLHNVEHFTPWESTVDPNAAPAPKKGSKKKPPPPPQATPSIPSAVPAPTPVAGGQPSADLATLAGGNSTLQAAIQQAQANGYNTSPVSYWPGLGVDPDAQVLGVTRYNTPQRGATAGIGGGPPTTAMQSADKWLGGLYKMSPMDLLAIQHRLWDAGWYIGTTGANGKPITDFGQLGHGRPDQATLQAYGSVLAETARYNHAGQQINIDGVIGMGSPGKTTGSGTGSPFQTTAPADLASAFKAQSVQMTGKESPDQQKTFEDQYLAEEDAARRQGIAAGVANQTVPIGGPGTPANEAEQFIDTHNLADKIAYGAAVRQQSFFDMLRSPVQR